MAEVKKAIILASDLGAEFLPLSKVVPKGLLPLVDKPLIYYLLQEIKNSGIERVVFVLNSQKKEIESFLKRDLKLERILKKKGKKEHLVELQNLEELQKGLSISYVFQEKPLGPGYAILKTKEKIKNEPFAVLSCNDIIESKKPAISQLLQVFKTCQKPVLGLYRAPKEKGDFYEVVEVEKIAHRLFKIKKIIEKPMLEKTSFDLGILDKYILTPEIFDYLEKEKPSEKGEITLTGALGNLLRDGKIVYGYEIEGRWLECRDKMGWLRSHLYLLLKHPQFGEELKKYLKEII